MMNWAKLCTFVDENRDKIPPDTPIAATGHYGEYDGDQELDGLIYKTDGFEGVFRERSKKAYIEMQGISASYEEPD